MAVPIDEKEILPRPQTFKHATHAAWRRVEGDGVILDLHTSVYYSINPVGVLSWEELGAGISLDGVVDKICREFDVEPQQAQRYTGKFIEKLVDGSLLDPV